MKEVAYSYFNEKLDFLDNEPTVLDRDQFMTIFKNNHKTCKTFGWIFNISLPFKGL